MKSQLYIPSKVKVGFNTRSDTYTDKLGFVTYNRIDDTTHHGKNWHNWIDESIPILDFDNLPRDGFILNGNKGGGGSRYRWDEREPKIRVWDPNGFEIEIDIPNTLDILEICGSYPGKGLDGNFVYAFKDKRLVLLPIKSEEYKNSMEFTSLKHSSVNKEDVKIGATYLTKEQKKVTYMGKHPYIHMEYSTSDYIKIIDSHIFVNGDNNFILLDFKHLAKEIDSTVISNFAELTDLMVNNEYVFSNKLAIKIDKNIDNFRFNVYPNPTWIKIDDKNYEYVRFNSEYSTINNDRIYSIKYNKKITITENGIIIKSNSKKDNNEYTLMSLSKMDFYDIKLNLANRVAEEFKRYTWYTEERKKHEIHTYSMKKLTY